MIERSASLHAWELGGWVADHTRDVVRQMRTIQRMVVI